MSYPLLMPPIYGPLLLRHLSLSAAKVLFLGVNMFKRGDVLIPTIAPDHITMETRCGKLDFRILDVGDNSYDIEVIETGERNKRNRASVEAFFRCIGNELDKPKFSVSMEFIDRVNAKMAKLSAQNERQKHNETILLELIEMNAQYPDMRFYQLLAYAFGTQEERFYVESKALVTAMEEQAKKRT